MRVLIVLLALVVAPFVAGVAQGKGKGHDPQHCARRLAKAALRHSNKDKGVTKCSDLPPPPPPPPAVCVNSPPSNGGVIAIEGYVYRDQDPWDDLASWCMTLTGPVNATAVTDAYGFYSFTGLPAGTYTVCETLQSGWTESFPSAASFGTLCPNGSYGWTLAVDEWTGASYINFGNLASTP
jgi:hypothetical protein